MKNSLIHVPQLSYFRVIRWVYVALLLSRILVIRDIGVIGSVRCVSVVYKLNSNHFRYEKAKRHVPQLRYFRVISWVLDLVYVALSLSRISVITGALSSLCPKMTPHLGVTAIKTFRTLLAFTRNTTAANCSFWNIQER